MNRTDEAIAALAQQLGLNVEKLWPVAVRYVLFDALVTMLIAIMTLLFTVIASRRLWRWLDAWEAEGEKRMVPAYGNPNDAFVPRTVLVLVAAISVIVCVVVITNHTPIVLNPEGYLVMKVLHR